jgi:hypothetical protein
MARNQKSSRWRPKRAYLLLLVPSQKNKFSCTSADFHNTCASPSQLQIRYIYIKNRSFLQYSDKLVPSNYKHCNSKLSIQHTHCHYGTHTVNTAHTLSLSLILSIQQTYCQYGTHTVNTANILPL